MKTMPHRLAEGVLNLLTTIFYTLKYNWFYILLSILAPLVIYQMGAGQEIIALLVEGPELLLNTIFLLLSMGLMSLTIWLVPSLAIFPMALYTRACCVSTPLTGPQFYRQLIHIYGVGTAPPGSSLQAQVPAKFLAMLPWTMICSTLIQFNIPNSEVKDSIFVFLSLNAIFLAVLSLLDAWQAGKRDVLHLVPPLAAICVAGAIIIYKFSSGSADARDLLHAGSQRAVVLMSALFIACMVAAFIGLTRGEAIYRKIAARPLSALSATLRRNNVIHAILIGTTLTALSILTILALTTQLPAVSTLTILLLCLNLYMLLVDYLFTAQLAMLEILQSLLLPGGRVRLLLYKVLIAVAFGVVFYFVFLNNTNNYRHTLVPARATPSQTLETYFDSWRQSRLSDVNESGKPMNVFLVSGQGGGSRAAVYFLAVLRRIEQSDQELYKQCFMISTISGSSAGVGQYIGMHENDSLRNFLKADPTDHSFEELKRVYSYNFFNSNLLGLLFYDRIPIALKNLFYRPESATYGSFNRNFVQENEERKQLESFTRGMIGQNDYEYGFFQQNMQDLYNRENARYRTPLVFFNTTVLSKGRKGIFSPLSDRDSLFGNNIDLLQDGQPVSFHFAELSSQSFPLLNNFSRIGDNYLGDGGIYENSGTSTTLKVYRQLRRHCDRNGYRVRFILLNIINASSRESEAEGPQRDKRTILSLLLGGVSSMPFDGHETDAKRDVVQEVLLNTRYACDTSLKDTAFNIVPQEQFALTRVFSPSTLNNFINQKKLDSSLRAYARVRAALDILDDTNKQRANTVKPIYRVYTQYRNRADKERVKLLLRNVENLVINIPPIDRVETAEYGNEIRYFHPGDSVKAVLLRARLDSQVGQTFRLLHVRNPALSAKTPLGQLELWIDRLEYSAEAKTL